MFWRKQHEVSQDDLSAYVDGELPPAKLQILERHLAGCEVCIAAAEELRAVAALLAAMPAVTPARSFTLTAAQAGLPVASRTSSGRSPFAFAPAIAAVLFLAIVGADLATVTKQSTDESANTGTVGLSMEAARQDAPSAGAALAPSASAPAFGDTASQPPALPRAATDDGDEKEQAGSPASGTAPSITSPEAADSGLDLSSAEEDEASGRRAWRIAEALALAAFVGALFLAWRARTAS